MGIGPTKANRLIDDVSNEFEESWTAEAPVDFQSWLSRMPEEQREDFLAELVRADVELRFKNNLAVDPDSYRMFGEAIVGLVRSLLPQEAPTAVGQDESASTGEDASDESEEPTLPPGSQKPDDYLRKIGNYELLRSLGGGGMGQVFLGRHHKFRERHFAVKLLKPNIVSEEALSRFEHEIDVAGKLEHPNIVFSHDAGRADNEPYLVMEFIQGCDLQELVDREGPLAVANACELVRQACEGLDFAFRKSGLTHRDVKPSNLMLAADQRVKVLDLGLARLREQSHSMGVTAAGQILGTPDYMAPEQWNEASKVSTTADIYSLACTLFSLLVGHPPFYSKDKSSVTAKMSAHLLDEPPRIRSLRPEIPEELAQVIQRGLAKNPAERFQTPVELAEALKPHCAGADLGVYRIAETSVGASAFVPTQKVGKQLTSVVTGQTGTSRTGSRKKLVAAGVVIAVLAIVSIILASSGMGRRNNTAAGGNPAQRKTQMAVLRLSAAQKFIDVVNNVETAEGQVVYEGERSRLEVLLPAKRHLMVLGITPATGDGKIACIWPLKTSEKPPLVDGFIFGKRAAEQLKLDFPETAEIGIRENTWVYSDGTGLHSFLAISSDSPLPSFDEIRQELASIDWPAENASPRHWTIQDGEAFQTEFDEIAHRGFDDSDSFSMQPVIDQIRKISGSQHIDGFVFNVESHPGN